MTTRFCLRLLTSWTFCTLIAVSVVAQERQAMLFSAGPPPTEAQRGSDDETVLRWHDPEGNQLLWTVSEPPGYVHGTNGYGDLGKAVAFVLPDGMDEAEIVRVNAHFVRSSEPVMAQYDLVIYDGSLDVGPQAPIFMQTFDVADIDGRQSAPWPARVHTLDGKVMTDGLFFVSFEWQDSEHATFDLAIAATDFLGGFSAYEWEMWDDGGWRNISTAWTEGQDGWHLWVEAVVRAPQVSDEDGARPREITLSSVHPNPIGDRSHVELDLAAPQHVRVTIYNLLGQRVAGVLDGPAPAGLSRIAIDGRGLSSGIYFVRVEGADFAMTRKFVVGR